MASVSARFRADVAGPAEAAAALRGLPAGAYITSRVSDAAFLLSYINRDREVQHVRIGRRTDGSFILADNVETPTFATLSELVSTRRYLQLQPAASGGQSAGLSTGAPASAFGVDELPANVAPPTTAVVEASDAAKLEAGLEAAETEGVRPPTRAEHIVMRLFSVAHLLCIAVLVAAASSAYHAWAAHSADAALLQEGAILQVNDQVDSASLRLARQLWDVSQQHVDGSDDESAVIRRCADAATSWVQAVHNGAGHAQGAPGAPRGVMELPLLQLSSFAPACTAAALVAVAVLLAVTLLKPPQQTNRRTGETFPPQAGLYRPRTLRSIALAAAWLLAISGAYGVLSQLWRLGGVATYAEVASLPYRVADAAELAASAAMAKRGGSADDVASAQAQRAEALFTTPVVAAALQKGQLPFRYRDRGSAYLALRLPDSCRVPLHAAIGRLSNDGAAVLYTEPSAFLPDSILQRVREPLGGLCAPPSPALGKAAQWLRSFVACTPAGIPLLALPSQRQVAGLVVSLAAGMLATVGLTVLLRGLLAAALARAGALLRRPGRAGAAAAGPKRKAE
jgi:hypothetical protein